MVEVSQYRKSQNIDLITEIMVGDLVGIWSIDPEGNLMELDDSAFPKTEPDKKDLDYNLYTAWVNYGGLFKKRIKMVSIELLNAYPRNKDAEKELLEMVKTNIEKHITSQLISEANGIKVVMETVEWQPWWLEDGGSKKN